MQHGGDLGEAAAHDIGDGRPWLDLSTGINPHPWPVPRVLRDAGWTRLPSRADLEALNEAARLCYGVPDEAALVAAPGTQALIQWLPRLAGPGIVAIVGPTYSEHGAAWKAAGYDVREALSLARAPQAARHIVVVQPNNPDGRVETRASLIQAAEAARERNGWLVVDESFADVIPGCSIVEACRDLPVVVLRSFGKFYGLAGLRLGFAVAPPRLAAMIDSALGPWAVSAPAIAVGTAALRDGSWAAAMRDRLAAESAELDGVLTRAGLAVAGGTSLFRLARHPNAAALHARLAEQRIWTRRFDWAADLLRFGLPSGEAGLNRLADALARAGAA